MRYFKLFMILWIMFLFISCTDGKHKIVKLNPVIDIKYYHLNYSKDSIIIKAVPNARNLKKEAVWKLCLRHGDYYIMSQGKWFPFMMVGHELDTIIHNEGCLLHHVIVKKINKDLYASSLSFFVVGEVLELEVYYNKRYEIKQVRSRVMWIDYVPNKDKPIDDIPLIYKFHVEIPIESKK